jgi:F-type H+-transporting ATPase subunit delta
MAGTRDVAGARYAAAVLAIAREEGNLDSWAAAVRALGELTAQPAFVQALQGDGMTDEKFQTVVRQVAPGITQMQLNLFRLLRRKSRLALGPSVASFFQDLLDEERGVARAVVTTAVDLDADRRAQLEQRLSAQTGKQVSVEAHVDPSILGGVVVRIGDRLLDGSTRTRLRHLRGQLERAL